MFSREEIQHGRDWRGEDVVGWYISEKLDGCFARWDGGRMWSKSGRRIQIPRPWSSLLPRVCVEGEIWAGRGQWAATVDAVVHNKWAGHVGFFVFDAPHAPGDWAARIGFAAAAVTGPFVATVPWDVVESMDHAAAIVRRIRLGGGEGVMLQRPGQAYRAGRCSGVVKLKKDPITGELAWRERRRIWARRAA